MRRILKCCALALCAWVALAVAPVAANDYPEFVGVYLKADGEYHKLPEAKRIDRLQFSELTPFRLPASGRMSTLPTLLARGHRFDAYASADIEVAPDLDGKFEGIFVRSRFPSEDLFLQYVTDLAAFATLQNPTPGGSGVEVSGRRGVTPLHAPLVVRTYCGFNSGNFNVQLVDDTGVLFIPTGGLSLSWSPTVGECGKSNTAKASAILVAIGQDAYLFGVQ